MNDKITVLYVDDEPINLQVFEINFLDKYQVLTAESGAGGLSLLKNKKNIAVVISDMKMPKMDGLEFVKKANEINPKIPCFILTGFDVTPQIEEAIEQGIVQKYLAKPFDLSEIDEAIQSVAS